MGVRSQAKQGYRPCIEPRNLYNRGHQDNQSRKGEVKADALNAVEGISPGCDEKVVMRAILRQASVQDTTGV